VYDDYVVRSTCKSARRGRIGHLLTVGLLGILVVPASAFGQAAADQYIPSAKPSGVGGGGADVADVGRGGGSDAGSEVASLGTEGAGVPAAGAEAISGSAGGGTLPFTGYPVTPFVAVLGALLVAGLLVRLTAPMIERRDVPRTGEL
jgi:hypothetical protein